MKRLESAYYTLRSPDSYGSAAGLQRQVDASRSSVRDFLSKQDAYTLHRDVVRRFPRRKTIALSINDLWQADLVDLSSLSRANSGFRYLLTTIDVFSKYARVAALKTKSASEVTTAFDHLIQHTACKLLQTDKGTEFRNSMFQKLLRDNNIRHYTSENDDIKCAVVERFHRTLLSKLYRYFEHRNTTRYIDILQDLVASYNDTYHSSIKMAPSAVDVHNESDVRHSLYSPTVNVSVRRLRRLRNKATFAVGDLVRISSAKRLFKKGYQKGWTLELFTVSRVLVTRPVTYGLTDLNGEPLLGTFYARELQKVIKDA